MSLLKLDNLLDAAHRMELDVFTEFHQEAVLVIEVEEGPKGEINFQPRMHRPETQTVLLVDPDTEALDQLEEVFTSEFEVVRASDGKAALSAAHKYQPAAVITVQGTTGMTGVELLADLEERLPTSLRVLVTARSDYDLLVDAINQAKIHHYVEKPLNPTQLKAAVDALIRAQAKRRGGRVPTPGIGDFRIAPLIKLKEYLWVDKQVCLGRQKENDLVIADPSVSKRHAHFIVSDDRVWVSDLGSSNGTKLNAVALAARRPARLYCGDELRFGRVWMTYRTPEGMYEYLETVRKK